MIKKYLIECTNFLKSTKSPFFPLRGKVGQVSERKRVLYWSIYILLVYFSPLPHLYEPLLVRVNEKPRHMWSGL